MPNSPNASFAILSRLLFRSLDLLGKLDVILFGMDTVKCSVILSLHSCLSRSLEFQLVSGPFIVLVCLFSLFTFAYLATGVFFFLPFLGAFTPYSTLFVCREISLQTCIFILLKPSVSAQINSEIICVESLSFYTENWSLLFLLSAAWSPYLGGSLVGWVLSLGSRTSLFFTVLV